MKRLRLPILLLTTFILSACGSGLSGTYSGERVPGMKVNLVFSSNNEVIYDAMGTRTQATYEVKGKDLKMNFAQGNQIFTIIDDDHIDAGMLGILTKMK